MAKDDQRTLTPRLRFPEFRQAEGWIAQPLGELFEITSCKRVHQSDWTESGVPFYRAREIVALHNGEAISPLYISTDLYESNIALSGAIEDGHLLVTGVGSIGVPYLVKQGDRFYFKDGNIIWLKNPGDRVMGRFVHILYCTGVFQTQITKMAGVGTVGTYTIDNAKQTLAVFPVNKAEQKKIADCLTSLDELIAAQGRKVEALKAHKKGLMQQLFPREGETLPRLRFPQFQDEPEWQTKPLGEIFETMTGGTPDRAVQENWGGSIPWITTSLVDFNVINNAHEFITELGLRSSSAKLFPKNTVLLALYGQGKTRGKVALLGIEATTNQACAAILPSDGIEPAFTFLSLCGRYDEMRGLSNSGGQENLSQGLVRELPFRYPKDIAEQQRIADCLSTLDAQISAETDKVAALKTHKQGLMQQLFPSPEGD